MAGKKQHFIPRLFVKYFSENPKTKNPKIWFYRYQKDPYSSGINDAPAKRYFYSYIEDDEINHSLDDKITEYEERTITPILLQLQSSNVGQQIDPILPAHLIYHLIFRNDHFRQFIASTAIIGLKTLKSITYNKNNLKSAILKDLSQPHGLFPIAINKKIKEYFPYHSEFELELIKNHVISNIVIPNIDEYTNCFIHSLNNNIDIMNMILNNYHNDITNSIMNENFYNTTEYINKLKLFKWSIKKTDEYFVLPDCISVSREGSQYNSLILSSLDDIDTVYCPISHNKMLIGSKTGETEVPENINLIFAENSWDFFISAFENKTNETLSKSIRKNPISQIRSILENLEKNYSINSGFLSNDNIN